MVAAAAKRVRAAFLIPQEQAGGRRMAVHTGDNVDLRGDNHYLLTCLVVIGMVLTPEEVTTFNDGIRNMPTVDTAVDLAAVQMTADDDAARAARADVRSHLLNGFLALVFSILIWSAVGAQLSEEKRLRRRELRRVMAGKRSHGQMSQEARRS